MKKFIHEVYTTFILHAVVAHFSNGLVPVAVGFLLLTLFFRDPYFEHTVLHLIFVVLLAIPFSFFSGIYEWRTKFNGRPAPVFKRKIRLSLLLFVLGATAVTIRCYRPEVTLQQEPLSWLYLGCLFATLPIVFLLGHYGAKLSASGRRG